MMHDCDVWIETLEGAWLSREGDPGTTPGDQGLIALLEDRKNERNARYRKFLLLWERFLQQSP